MDLKFERESHGQSDMSWLGNWDEVTGSNVGLTVLLADFDADTHYPDRFLQPGLLIAQYTSGGNSGEYGPYTPSETNGLQTAIGCIFSGFHVRHDRDGDPIATKIHGAVMLAKTPLQVFVSKMPGTLNATPAAHTIVTADLPSGWQDLDAL